jgi:hypothetical protein
MRRNRLKGRRVVLEAQKDQREQYQSDKHLLPGLSLDSLDDVVASRRGFLTLLTAGSVALFLATVPFVRRFVGRREEHFPKVALGKMADLPRGEARTFAYPGKDNPALLMHLPNGE